MISNLFNSKKKSFSFSDVHNTNSLFFWSLRFALMRFDHRVCIDFMLEDSVFYSLHEMKNKISKMRYKGGSTFTQLALKEVKDKIFQGATRAGVPKTCILMTDGKTYGGSDKVIQPSKELRVSYNRLQNRWRASLYRSIDDVSRHLTSSDSLGVLSIIQNGRKSRSRNVGNTSVRVEIFCTKWSTSRGGALDRSVRSNRNLPYHFQKFSFPDLLW